jgi:DNA-binding MarR family transcriptional regulator
MNAVNHTKVLAEANILANLLRSCAKLMAQRAERLLNDGEMNLTQCKALMLIKSREATTPSKIAECLGQDAGATTRTVEHLKRKGLLKRRREIKDRRVVTLVLTPPGCRKARECRRILTELDRHILTELDRLEIETLISLLTRLMTALETANSF